MKVYRVELMILDFENTDEESIRHLLEQNRYINPHVLSMESREIGEWSDDHPLNMRSTQKQEMDHLFGHPESECSSSS